MRFKDHKILVLPSFYPMKYDYPRGNFFEEQSSMLKSMGIEIDVAFNENRSLSKLSLRRLKYAHFQISFETEGTLNVMRRRNWNIIPSRYKLGRKLWIKQSMQLVEKYIDVVGRPAIIHVQCTMPAGIVALKLKRKYGIPYIISEHSSHMHYGIQNEDIDICKDVIENSDGVTVVSTFLKKLIVSEFKIDESLLRVIPNFIDTNFFEQKERSKKTYNILTVSYHTANKNIEKLIEAFSKLPADLSDFMLVIGGEGPHTPVLKQLVKKLGIENKVTFLGFLNRQQVKEAMISSDLFVLTSEFETFGVVLIEAMAMGIPVVSTKCGGPQDIIVPNTGLLVGESVDEITNGISYVLMNYKAYSSSNIRYHVLKHFSKDSVAYEYINLYSEVLQKR